MIANRSNKCFIYKSLLSIIDGFSCDTHLTICVSYEIFSDFRRDFLHRRDRNGVHIIKEGITELSELIKSAIFPVYHNQPRAQWQI